MRNVFYLLIREITLPELTVLGNANLNRKKNIQKSLDEVERLNRRKTFIEEQYMDGELPAHEYQDLKNNINTRLFNEKSKLQEQQEVLSPFREYLDNQVPMLEDLVGFYKSVDGRLLK